MNRKYFSPGFRTPIVLVGNTPEELDRLETLRDIYRCEYCPVPDFLSDEVCSTGLCARMYDNGKLN